MKLSPSQHRLGLREEEWYGHGVVWLSFNKVCFVQH